ncbi:hypothetical protein GFS03_13115 [Sulfolobus sp. E5-1-F]|uniref:hypothetical protein n=1 Tax=Sulfolobaceae TaxID=118883 RepID=UPI0012951847|nr:MULTISPECIES: hypothetical protein [unclassified Sulfolobus]QGA55440.1 hypothetical protein GFS03_13115 [Sulfolobus sp. E5-1-F]QGA68202.1 hypothetical protein GFS33_04995 [Sulfolobus sp. E11-6]
MNIWLAGAGIAILQTLIGNIIVFYNYPSLLLLHVLVAIVLLAITSYGYFKVKLPVEKRILAGNIGLIVITGALGYLYTGVFSCSHLIRYIIVKLYQIISNILYCPQVDLV